MRRAHSWIAAPALLAIGGLSAAVIAGISIACGDSSPTDDGPPIGLPDRDGAARTDAPPACESTTITTTSDPNNCGSCGNVCAAGAHAKPSCVDGKCALTCESGWGDCNGNASDGCEMDLSSTIEHCGACKRDCRTCEGTICAAGECDAKTLSTRPRNIQLLALDATDTARVTYADSDEVAQVDKTDAGVRSVYGVPSTPQILVKSSVLLIYPGTESFSGIYRTTAGFVGPQIAAYARGEDAEAMAIDDTGIYYAVAKGAGASKVMRCKDCSVATELSGNENSVGVSGIALDETTVFFGAGDMIRRVEKTGAELKTIAVGQKPRSLVVDATHVYWINEAPLTFPSLDAGGATPKGEVVRLPKAGGTGTSPEKIIVGLSNPLSLLLGDNGRLYIADRGATKGAKGVLLSTAKDGSDQLVLAKDITTLGSGIATDATCVWFGAGTQLRKVAR